MKIFETVECSSQILSNSLSQFWNDHLIPLKILYLSSVSWKTIPLYVFGSSNIYFAPKDPIKKKIFETFECSGQILSNSLCQFWNDKLISPQILYPSSVSWRPIPLYVFSSNNIYFAQKEPIKKNIFGILWNSLFQCWKDKWIPLQIFCPSLISRKIIPLYFFSSRNIYFAPKEPIKIKIFVIFECTGQIPYPNFETTSPFLSKNFIPL